ncbi:hypothetical protein D3C79_746970 [compost metagenome]
MTQPADQQVDGTVEDVGFATLGQVEQLLAAQHPLRVVEKHPEQAIFGATQGHQGAFAVEQVAGGGIQAPLAEGEQAAAFADGQVGRQHAGAAQHGVDAGQQLAGRERLGQVVVGAHFEADDAIGLVVARGQHQHRRVAMLAGAQLTAQQQAVVAGHHDVEHDQVDAVGFEEGAHLPAVGDDAGTQTVLLQIVADQFADLAVIVNDQDVIDVFHALGSCSWGRAQCTERCHACLRRIVLQCIWRLRRYRRKRFRGLATQRGYVAGV